MCDVWSGTSLFFQYGDELSSHLIAWQVSAPPLAYLPARQTLQGGEKCHYYFKGDKHWVLLPQFMSNKSTAILLMDVKPWQRQNNQNKVRPFKSVLTTWRKWQISHSHTIRRREAAGWGLLSGHNTKAWSHTKSAIKTKQTFSTWILTDKSIRVNTSKLNMMPGAVTWIQWWLWLGL